MKTVKDELVFRAIKITDIGYITVLYFFTAFLLSTWVDYRLLGRFDPKKADAKSTAQLLMECVLHVYLVGVLIYIIRNIIELIPSPLDGIAGFQHSRVKELTNAAVFTFIFLLYQRNLREKLFYIGDRIYGVSR
jgi:hypothetical protein